jgi:hypothetical protein
MSLTESANQLLDSIIEMPAQFAEVVTTHLSSGDPVTAAIVAVLMGFGALFVALSVGAFGYLSLGALVEFLSVENA